MAVSEIREAAMEVLNQPSNKLADLAQKIQNQARLLQDDLFTFGKDAKVDSRVQMLVNLARELQFANSEQSNRNPDKLDDQPKVVSIHKDYIIWDRLETCLLADFLYRMDQDVFTILHLRRTEAQRERFYNIRETNRDHFLEHARGYDIGIFFNKLSVFFSNPTGVMDYNAKRPSTFQLLAFLRQFQPNPGHQRFMTDYFMKIHQIDAVDVGNMVLRRKGIPAKT